MTKSNIQEHLVEAQWVVKALENIMRPIVRLLFHRRIGFQVVHAVLKRMYVEIAIEEAVAANPFKKPSVSAIALRSGVDVRDVKREWSSLEESQAGKDLSWVPPTSAETAVLQHWAEKPPFVDEDGNPVVLKAWGPGLSFERLVKRVCGNVGAAKIRDRLYDASCIEIDSSPASPSDYRLTLVKRFIEPSAANERSLLEIASASIRHLAHTLGHNLDHEKSDRMLQQERWTRRLRREDVQAFRETVMNWARNSVKESEDLISSYEKDEFARDEHVHAGIGLYYFEETPRTRGQFQFAT